jgi:60 kDa SS-A/Ro ribonucleoprotein
VIKNTEPWSEAYGFTSKTSKNRRYFYEKEDSEFTDLKFSKSDKLSDILKRTRDIPFGRTDCSMPMREALKNDWDVDTFIIITDNETYAGLEHPHQSLTKYRNSKESRKDARLIVLSVTASKFTIADPSDPLGQLDICGFGADVPQLVSTFSSGV